jgi:hypothetical protein
MAFNKGSTSKTSDTQNYTVNGLTGNNFQALGESILSAIVALGENSNQTTQYLAGITSNSLGNLTTETGKVLNKELQTVGTIEPIINTASLGAIQAEQQTAQGALATVESSVQSQLAAAQGMPVVQTGFNINTVIIAAAVLGGGIILLIFVRKK